jgi:hypothetical protein
VYAKKCVMIMCCSFSNQILKSDRKYKKRLGEMRVKGQDTGKKIHKRDTEEKME